MVISDFIFILIVFDIYSLYFYFNVYLLYVAHVIYIIKRIWYGMVAGVVFWCYGDYGFVSCGKLNVFRIFETSEKVFLIDFK